MPRNAFYIGLAGFGTVGSGLADVLAMNRAWIKRRTGRDIVIKTVADLDANKKNTVQALGASFTTDAQNLIRDPEVDIVVELIGGTNVARELIKAALKAGKHVVTANKALLAEFGPELFALAAAGDKHLGYEASVAGGIPLVQTFKGSLAGNRTEKVLGILNGTSNFILTEMTVRGMDFTAALKLAQEKGYAEADPTLDIEGVDAAHKLVLLVRLAFGKDFPLSRLTVTGISKVEPMDIHFAREFGYQIKLIAQAGEINGKIEAGVFPALVPETDLLAAVHGSFNAVRLTGNAGPIMLHGYGAGDLPTGSAVLADIMAVARGREPDNTGFVDPDLPPAQVMDPLECEYRHYFRFVVADRPGVMAGIAHAMAGREISIAQAVQKGDESAENVPIVFLTHTAKAGAVKSVLEEINAMDFILAPTVHYRIL